MRLTITIDCDNAAFGDSSDPYRPLGNELARILKEESEKLMLWYLEPGDKWVIRDVNGNTVGKVKVTRG